jgi:PAS domain S-box-containing protein
VSKNLRARLDDAESTLAAIRSGQVDALVVSGPAGDQTVAIEGATHPYFVLLNAMNDGAALLEPSGAILFGNRSLGKLAGSSVSRLRGERFQQLIVPAQRSNFRAFLLAAALRPITVEYTLRTAGGGLTPVAISLSALSEDALMAIVVDLTYRKSTEAARTILLERLISAEDDERRRIARELHDETGQSLAALMVGLRAITALTTMTEVHTVALRLRDVAAQTVDEVRRLARGLHPAVLDDMGLAAAAMRYVGDYVQLFRTAVDFVSGDIDSPRLPPLTAATVYRILQESLTNIAKHAQATSASVELIRDAAGVGLIVRDHGVGFDASTVMNRRGLGLNGMRERVTLLGGTIHVESRLGEGTTVRLRVPAPSPAPPPAPQKALRHRGRLSS